MFPWGYSEYGKSLLHKGGYGGLFKIPHLVLGQCWDKTGEIRLRRMLQWISRYDGAFGANGTSLFSNLILEFFETRNKYEIFDYAKARKWGYFRFTCFFFVLNLDQFISIAYEKKNCFLCKEKNKEKFSKLKRRKKLSYSYWGPCFKKKKNGKPNVTPVWRQKNPKPSTKTISVVRFVCSRFVVSRI